jgi:hypothetical protein
MLFTLAVVAIALPATWTSVHAQSQVQIEYFRASVHPARNIVRLVWRMSEDTALTSIVVENSLDNVNFTPIGEVPPVFTGGHGSDYEFWHVNPANGLNYYQLRLMFSHGGEQLSSVAKVEVGAPPIYTYPRPRGIVNGDTDNSWSEALVTDIYGRPVFSARDEQELNFGDLPMGIYVLNVRYETGEWQTTTFMVGND